ncbi:hypothetical protein [Shewanella sp. 1180_01]|uniref:hypothetical protein n=1 Tax=Shewanella sp. 1180_01 TaxID=2604451 RepID=UPI0040647A81
MENLKFILFKKFRGSQVMSVDERVYDYCEFIVDLTKLDEPRLPGISAILRIKNGAEFLRSSIESHLPYYDEIVACYNDCSDNTAEILKELSEIYPEKIKVFEYLPKVHPIFSGAHNSSSTDNVHSLANFSNFTLSKVRYNVATKLDDDHIAIDRNLAPVIDTIRRDIMLKVRKIYTFSGVNLALDANGKLGVFQQEPLVGTGDHMYFPVSSKIYFSQEKDFESFHFVEKNEKKYMGIMYFHLKYLKEGCGFVNLEPKKRAEILTRHLHFAGVAELDDFISESSIKRLRKHHNPIEYWLRTQHLVNKTIYSVLGRNPPLRIARLSQLYDDLNGLKLDECVVKRIKRF